MNQVTCAGTINADPTSVTDSSFPAGSTTIPFALNPPNKPFAVDTGRQLINVNSPSAFLAVGAIGAGGAVTQANFLYVRSPSPMKIRVTQLNPGSTVTTAVSTIAGLFLLEPETGFEITLVEFEGAGSVELYASGSA